MNKEIWKDIKGYEGLYQISNFGRVWSFIKNKFLINSIDKGTGYGRISLYKNKQRNTINTHTIVWDNFADKPRDGRKIQVDHIDENKLNNRIDNLQLLNNRENTTKRSNQKSKTSKYTGVNWHKPCNKWRASIYNKKTTHLGLFNDEYEAHLAYQNELKKII